MRYLVTTLLAIGALSLNTASAYADLGDQLFKLLANDGAEFDGFGVSVAICGATAIVGASGDDDNGSQSGSAYLFDTTAGQQLFKLLPDDGAELDVFGILRTMYDPRANLSNEVSMQLIEHFDRTVFRTVIPRNIRLAEAPSFGRPVLLHDRSSRGAISYLALAGEILRREDDRLAEAV